MLFFIYMRQRCLANQYRVKRLTLAPIMVLIVMLGQGLLPGIALGQSLPLGGGESETAEIPMPEVGRLQPGWWNAISGPDVDRAARIAALKTAIDEAVLSLSVADSGDIPQRAEVAKERLEAFAEELGREPEDTPDIIVRTDGAFSLNDLFNSADEIRTREIALTDLNENLTGSKDLLAQSRSRYDADILNHRAEDEGSIGALSTSILAIASRASLAVLELRDGRSEARQKRLEREINQFRQQLVVGRAQLSPEGFDLEATQQELDSLADQLGEAQTSLDVRRRELLEVDETTPEGQVRAQLIRQQLLAALIKTTRLDLTRMRQRGVILWHEGQTEEGVDPAVLQEHLDALRALLDQSEGEFNGWQRLTVSFLLDPPSDAITARARDLRNADQQARELAVNNLREIKELSSLLAQERLLDELLSRELAGTDTGWAAIWLSIRLAFDSMTDTASQWVNLTPFTIGDDPVTLGELLKVALILFATYLLSWLVRKALQRMKDRRHITQTHSLYAASRILHYLIITVGFLIGLSTLGLNFTSIALIAGALSVGIGFGLQTTVNNFVSGLILLFDRSLKVGDYVELDSGLRGTVREISVRATRINTNDNVDVVVPNSEFVSTRLVNWTMVEGFARLRVNFGVAYGTDKDLVKQVALKATERVDYTLKHIPAHEPQIRLVNFGDNSLDFQLLVWVNRSGVQRPGRARAAYMWELESGLAQAGIEIPFPQRDLHIRSNSAGSGIALDPEPGNVIQLDSGAETGRASD